MSRVSKRFEETMLMGGDELVSDEVVHHDVSDYSFHNLAGNCC